MDAVPEWVDKDAWSAYVEMRRSMGKRAPFTALAEKRTLHDLEKLEAEGHPNGEVLWQSVTAGYRGVFPLKNRVLKRIQAPAMSFKEQDEQRLAERVREMTGGIVNCIRQNDFIDMEESHGTRRIETPR